MEWKIGEIRQVDGEWYQCTIANYGCFGCTFTSSGPCTYEHKCECLSIGRSDKKSVIFKKLEKVGEPYYDSDNKLCQQYKCYIVPLITDEIVYVFADNRVVIEIKQNKEDMSNTETLWYGPDKKEAKSLELSNLKPFSLEAAKSGKPVCTRDGRKARIIAVGLNNKTYPLAAVIENNGEEDEVHNYTSDGLVTYGTLNDADLMMFPEKKGGWVNVYRDCDGVNITKDDNIYSSKDAAIASAQIIDRDNYVATTIINWEE